MGGKRSRGGQKTPQHAAAGIQKRTKRSIDVVDGSNATPPGAQPPVPSSRASTTQSSDEASHSSKRHKSVDTKDIALPPAVQQAPNQKRHGRRQKLPRLPDNVSISKRPIHHPAQPSPFASAACPKTLYITHSSPFIPAVKRIRRLLSEVSKRAQQSASAAHPSYRKQKRSQPLQATGRLKAADVEREIVEGSGEKGHGVNEEEVFVKATGRAIERALQIGVYFQGEDDCTVRVETGSVQAIDDIEIKGSRGQVVEELEDPMEVDKSGQKLEGNKGEKWNDEDIPETRIRTLSSITVAIRLK